MKCFVTGANGFIGRRLCAYLKDRGYTVLAGMRQPAAGPWSDAVAFDLLGQGVKPASLAGVSVVFHLAGKAHALHESAQDEKEYFRINAEGTGELLESAREACVRRFVLFSSVKAVCEGGERTLDELASCKPTTPYGASKLEAEKLVLSGGYVPEPVVLRLNMVYGPTSKGNLPRMITAISRGRLPPLPEVRNRRSMVHVDDVVRAAVLAAEHPAAADNVYIVSDGRTYSTRELYEWCCDALGRPVPGWSIPVTLLRLMAAVGDGVGRLRTRRFVIDSDVLDKLFGSSVFLSGKMETELGFRPENDLRTSLPEIVAHLGLARDQHS